MYSSRRWLDDYSLQAEIDALADRPCRNSNDEIWLKTLRHEQDLRVHRCNLWSAWFVCHAQDFFAW